MNLDNIIKEEINKQLIKENANHVTIDLLKEIIDIVYAIHVADESTPLYLDSALFKCAKACEKYINEETNRKNTNIKIDNGMPF